MRVLALEDVEGQEASRTPPANPLYREEYVALVTTAEEFLEADARSWTSDHKATFADAVRDARRRLTDGR